MDVQFKRVSSILAHRSTLIEYLVSYSNGYSPIYFTTKFNRLIKRHLTRVPFFFYIKY